MPRRRKVVKEFEHGQFGCERSFCNKRFQAEDTTNPKSVRSARREARQHESRNAEHVRVLNLADLPTDPKREGFVIVLQQKKRVGLLSDKLYHTAESAQNDGTAFAFIAGEGDLIREEERRAKARARRERPKP